MKTVNSSIEIFFSLAGILALTFMTVSIYQILSPQIASEVTGNVAGLVTRADTLEPDVDLLNSHNRSLTFKTDKRNYEYTVFIDSLEGSAEAGIFKFRNPNVEERKVKVNANLAESDRQFFEIEFIYKNQTLKLNSLTGFSKSITLPANSTLDVAIRVTNLLQSIVEDANFKLSLEY